MIFCFPILGWSENGNFYLNTESLNITTSDVMSYFPQWFNLDQTSTFEITKDREDQFGTQHITYQQYVDGIMVEKCILLVHAKDGFVTSVNGHVMELIQQPSNCNKKYTRSAAVKKIPAKTTGEQDLVIVFVQKEDSIIYRYAYKFYSNETFTYYYVDVETGEIIKEESTILSTHKTGTAYTYYQGWKNINYSQNNQGTNILLDEKRNIYTVDASAIDVNDYINTVYDYTNPTSEWYEPVLASVKITSITQSWWYNSISDTKPDLYIKVKNSKGDLLYTSGYFSDTNPPVTFTIPIEIPAAGNLVIEIYDYDGVSDDYGGSVNVNATEAGTYSWSGTKTSGEVVINKHSHPALDVHWGMEKVYDFYLNKFSHKSFDGQGSQICQLVAPPSSIQVFQNMGFPNQACAVGALGMVYGMGDGTTMNPVVAIDVMGHEFTHMVTAANGNQNLPGYGIGGALNESYADIIGMCIKNYATGNIDWLIGNGVMIGSSYGMRSMKNPKIAQHPNCYKGTYYKTPTGNPTAKNDQDYVHSNNGVQNYWFYLLCNGGSGTNDLGNTYNVVGIGIDKAVQIAYSSLVDYIQSNDGWFESREHTLEAAATIYGKTSQAYKSVANAWYAVGVGDPYQELMCVKAKIPSNWGSTILAYMWTTGEGSWCQIPREGDWCIVADYGPYNIIFVNGNTWNGDNNQTVDIAVTGDMCLQISNNTSGKRTYSVVNCPERTCVGVPYSEPFKSSIGAFTYVEYKKDYNLMKDIWQFDSQYGMVAKATYSNTKYASNAWLMSPCIEIPATGTYILTFQHAARYFSNAGTEMALWVSTDYEGLEYLCNWTQLTIPTYPTGSNWNFVNSGEISLAAYAGKNITLAFKYTSTSSIAPQWEIKNLKVEKKTGSAVDEVQASSTASNKYIDNGQFIIKCDGVRYNAQGQRLQ